MDEGSEEVTQRPREYKVRFRLDPENGRGVETEDMWAESLGDSRYRLLNSPFFTFGVSAEDIVLAEQAGDSLAFRRVLSRGGHSTYRLYLQNGETIQSSNFNEHWKPISSLGATFENANDRFVAVDIPPKCDVQEIYRLLQAGEDDGFWAFEEVHYQPSN
jgi:hypothetical protein